MKEKTFKKIKILSVILGFSYCGGAIWYGELFFSRPLPLLLLLGTGIALVIAPLLSDALLRLHYVRFFSMLLILTGIGGSLYTIGEAVTSTGYWYWCDLLVVTLQQIVIISVLVILGLRVVGAMGKKGTG